MAIGIREAVVQRKRRLSARTMREDLKGTMGRIIESENYTRLSTITAVDTGPQLEVIYHILLKDALLSLRVQVSKEEPVLPTVTDLVSGAVLYEREVHDLFGIDFEGNPDLSPLLLPERWPDDVHPLRKEWTAERISERMRRRR